MRAIVIREPGGPDVLDLRELPVPEPSRLEVRVRVHAAGVNRADLLQRRGQYPAPADAPRDIPGLEIAGEVDSVGEEALTDLRAGDRVFGLVSGGAYAEYVVVHPRTLARLDPALSFTQAAAVPEAFLTAWDALVDQAGLLGGETVLIHAAGGGVGSAAVQIAGAIGARPIGTVRQQEKVAKAREAGLSEGQGTYVVAERATFAERVLALTGGRGVDVILDLVGGSYVPENLKCAGHRARVVVVGIMGGPRTEIDLGLLMGKRIQIRGTMLRSRGIEEKILLAQTLERNISPLLGTGALRPIIDRVLPLERASDAHRAMESNEAFGKIVLEI